MPASECGLPFSTPAGWSVNMDNGQYRATPTRINKTIAEVPGNEQWSEREGQPLGPPEIKAPLTQVGVSAEINNGNQISGYRRNIVSGATGRPIVRSFRPWKRGRGRSEFQRDWPVPLPLKWTGDRRSPRRPFPGNWTGGCGRLKTFSQSLRTEKYRHGESRRP